jgi:hypothetical protein
MQALKYSILVRSMRLKQRGRGRNEVDHHKTIVDDSESHAVFFTILESNTEAKIYWKSMNGEQTTIMRGRGVKAFQTAGLFRIEALGDEDHSFKYGYALFRLKSNSNEDKKGSGDKI